MNERNGAPVKLIAGRRAITMIRLEAKPRLSSFLLTRNRIEENQLERRGLGVGFPRSEVRRRARGRRLSSSCIRPFVLLGQVDKLASIVNELI